LKFSEHKEELYEERALGEFENSLKDEKLHAMFEEIRDIIHET
jgi:hypothetical protein